MPDQKNDPVSNLQEFLYTLFKDVLIAVPTLAVVVTAIFLFIIGLLYFFSRIVLGLP